VLEYTTAKKQNETWGEGKGKIGELSLKKKKRPEREGVRLSLCEMRGPRSIHHLRRGTKERRVVERLRKLYLPGSNQEK